MVLIALILTATLSINPRGHSANLPMLVLPACVKNLHESNSKWKDFIPSLRRPSGNLPAASRTGLFRHSLAHDFALYLLTQTERTMNWDQIKGKWKQAKGQVRQKWGQLTDDDVDVINGKREELIGKVQERYGLVKEEAERQVKDFETNCRC